MLDSKKSALKRSDGADILPAPDVERGDMIYFRTPKGPAAGKVLARGAHGVTIDHDGERRQCRWADIHGHKTKVRPSVKVVDQGVDGMIVEDDEGQRRYVHDPLEQPASEPLTKSIMPAALLIGSPELFLKAVGNRGPVTFRPAAPKGADQTKPWSKTGDRVTFKHPDGHQAEGDVVGEPGADGAYVKDAATGETHQVLRGDIRPARRGDEADRAEGAGKPADLKPVQSRAEGADEDVSAEDEA